MASIELIAGGAGLAIGCILFRDTLDPRRLLNLPVKVNCWFCCNDARVPYESKNAWFCPRGECLQYNGFSADGGYNRDIPQQHTDPDEIVGGRMVRYAQKTPSLSGENRRSELSNGLCSTCNLNQDLKVHQLRTFTARNEENYDQEIQEFAAHLDRTYRLCRYCEAMLHQTLGEQDSWLKPQVLCWKLEHNRQSPLSSSKTFSASGSNKANRMAKTLNQLLRIAMFLSAVFVWFLTCSFSSLEGVIAYINNYFCLENDAMYWLKESVLTRIANLSSFESSFISAGYRQDIVVTAPFMLVLATYCHFREAIYESLLHKACLATWCSLVLHVMLKAYQIASIPENILIFTSSMCLLTSFVVSIVGFIPGNKIIPLGKRKKGLRCENNLKFSADWQWNDLQVSGEDDTLTQDLVSTSTRVGSIDNLMCPSIDHTSTAMSTIAPSKLNRYNSSSPNERSSSALPPHEIYQAEQNSTSEKRCDISMLHIDSAHLDNYDAASMTSGTFSLKRYDAFNSSGIDFGHNGNRQNGHLKGPLVKPPRFTGKSVAQSSWVAGGYWSNNKYQQNKCFNTKLSGKGGVPETMSQNSSQSSGFVSYSGQVQVSRMSSILNRSKLPCDKTELASKVPPPFAGQNANLNVAKEGTFCAHFPDPETPNLDRTKSSSTFSLNPISDQLAFFDTSAANCAGSSRPCSPSFLATSYDKQKNEFFKQTTPFSRSHQLKYFNDGNEKEHDHSSFNSSLDRLTQEAFSVLQPRAESSPKSGVNNITGTNPALKTWMERKITINISLYSFVLLLSVAANVVLSIYYML